MIMVSRLSTNTGTEIHRSRDILDNSIETSITNASDHAAFMALFDQPVDSDGNPTGNPPIADWPE